MVGELIERGSAYVIADGVYLSVDSVEGYGLLAHQSLDEMVAGGGDRAIVGGDDKRHPADFVLWKLAKPGEPAWPSPWGDGRPGWHTECVVMSLDLLGDRFDLHGGGMDLAFPHHENERAQAVALGRDFAGHWVHNGFVEVGGEKMSKSLGNFTTLTDLVAEHDPRAYRLLVLQSHYRSPLEVTPPTIAAAEASLDRLDALARRHPTSERHRRRRRSRPFGSGWTTTWTRPRCARSCSAWSPPSTGCWTRGIPRLRRRWSLRGMSSLPRWAWRSARRLRRGPRGVADMARRRDEAVRRRTGPPRICCVNRSWPQGSSPRTAPTARSCVGTDRRSAASVGGASPRELIAGAGAVGSMLPSTTPWQVRWRTPPGRAPPRPGSARCSNG